MNPNTLFVRRHGSPDNFRFYVPATGSYVTLEALKTWAAQGRAVLILDDATKKDVTELMLAD